MTTPIPPGLTAAEQATLNSTTLSPADKGAQLVKEITDPQYGLTYDQQVRELTNLVEREVPSYHYGSTLTPSSELQATATLMLKGIVDSLQADPNLKPLIQSVLDEVNSDQSLAMSADDYLHLGIAAAQLWQQMEPPT